MYEEPSLDLNVYNVKFSRQDESFPGWLVSCDDVYNARATYETIAA